MIEHTPGPWRAEGATVKAVSHGRWFKVTRAAARNHTPQGNANNAQLIAAAPELLAALKRCAPWLGKMIADGGHNNACMPNDAVRSLEMAEAAIKKATR